MNDEIELEVSQIVRAHVTSIKDFGAFVDFDGGSGLIYYRNIVPRVEHGAIRTVLSEGQSILDVGINWIEPEHRFVGDVRFTDDVSICHAITPVPGGIGSVTTARLLYNTCLAARLQSRLDQS